MHLTEEEEAMRAGERGAAVQAALESQIAVGEFFGAGRLVPVVSAHVMADWDVMGAAGYAHLERLVAAGGRVAVPTTRNPGAVDFSYAERLRQSRELVEGERAVRILLSRLGVELVDTCVGHASMPAPQAGEHIACGDTGAAIYANSVLGARTNFESGPAAIAAALTGRTPAYGFHLEETRAPTIRCRVNVQPADAAEWGALGAAIGLRLQAYWAVPVLEGLEVAPSSDELRHLGASLASYGSLAMFHIPGVTPEAPPPARVDGTELEITDRELDAVFASHLEAGDDVDVVVFTAPQLSLAELERLSGLLGGRRVHPKVTLIATANAATREEAVSCGAVGTIEAAGGMVLQGTCWYLMAPAAMGERCGWRRLVTNSAKLANIAKASNYTVSLQRTAACVEAAVSGRLPAR